MGNGLLPDLKDMKSGQNEKKKPSALVEFDYDNTNAEVDGAMKTFQYNFGSKRGILSIAAYSLLLVLVIVMLVINPTAYVLYAALLVCLGGLFLSVTAKKRMRKKVIQALDSMDPETYHCRLFPEKIEIETIIKHKEKPEIENSGNSQEDPENQVEQSEEDKPIMTVYDFSVGYLDFAENHDSYLLVVARKQFHCFPKRCLTEEQREIFKNTLVDKTSMF